MSEREYKGAEFRRQAALCLEVADRLSLQDDRDRVIEMAKRLLDLALEEERKSE
jgi:hypothetical protein